jgi:hypothetical protein
MIARVNTTLAWHVWLIKFKKGLPYLGAFTITLVKLFIRWNENEHFTFCPFLKNQL